MAPGKRKSDLTLRQRALLDAMQRVRFGRIEHLIVRDGDPVLERGTTRVVRSIRFEGENGAHSALDREDTVLKARVVNLLQRLEEMGEGMVAVLHFGDGLPGSMEIVEECGDRPGVPAEESPAPLCPPLRGAAAQAVERR